MQWGLNCWPFWAVLGAAGRCDWRQHLPFSARFVPLGLKVLGFQMRRVISPGRTCSIRLCVQDWLAMAVSKVVNGVAVPVASTLSWGFARLGCSSQEPGSIGCRPASCPSSQIAVESWATGLPLREAPLLACAGWDAAGCAGRHTSVKSNPEPTSCSRIA